MYRVCSFAAGQLIVDAQAQAYTGAHLLPHSVRFTTQCRYELQFVDLRYYKQHNRRKGIASHWN